MHNAGNSQEVERLKKVYKTYRDEEAISQRWNVANLGNQAIQDERQAVIRLLFEVNGFFPLAERQILDVGCGSGGALASLVEWGAHPENLYGIDLLPERIEAARQAYPNINFECGNAECLRWSDGTFDLVLLSTVFSSILDDGMALNIAKEVQRVLKRSGGVLWYDFRYNNPYNPHVRGMTKRHLRLYFPGFKVHLRTVTLLPPLARRLGKLTTVCYPVLSRITPLRTHYLALLIKP